VEFATGWGGQSLTAVPLAKLFGGPDPKFHFALEFDRDTNAEEIDVRIGW
jgi:hypothetical protein